MKFLLAVDQSRNSENAFFATLSLMADSKDDSSELIVFSAAKRSQASSYGAWGVGSLGLSGVDLGAITRSENERNLALARGIVASYLKRARDANIPHVKGLCGLTDSIPDLVCDVAVSRNCDFIVMGRTGAGRIKRAFLGSVSDAVLRSAPCHVILIKGEPLPEELHESDRSTVAKAEEAEREARIADEATRALQEEKAAFLQSSLNAHITLMAEEEERRRRVEEDGPAEIHDSNLDAIKAAEEAERQERIAEEAARDAAERQASASALAFAKRAEEAERARRLAEGGETAPLSDVISSLIAEVEMVGGGASPSSSSSK